MFLTSVCIEVRRKLQSANVHLTFDDDLSKCQGSLKILLKPSEIAIKYAEQTSQISLTSFFTIDQESISSLVIEGKNVSFRVLLSNETGSLDLVFDDVDDPPMLLDSTKPAIKVNIAPDTEYQLKCSNCENTLLASTKQFRRILELPSEFIGISDWFCHQHGPAAEQDLTPKLEDLFYGLYFIAINFTSIANIICKERFIYCKRCLKFIGEKVYRDRAVKFWNDTVLTEQVDGTKQQLFLSETPTQCVRNIIHKILGESLAVSKLHSMQMLKILFETTLSNRKRNFLMFNVVERNLDIMKNFQVSEGSERIDLDETKTMKVLFKVEASVDQPLVTFWQNDFNVQNVTISYKMFGELVRMLQTNSQLVPETYRYSNGFCLSYFFMFDVQ